MLTFIRSSLSVLVMISSMAVPICQGLLRRVKWRQTASTLSQGGDLHVPGGHKVACATHLVHDFRVSVNCDLNKMIHPSTVPLQEEVTFTYRASVFNLPGREMGGFNPPPHCRRTTSPLELVWGVGFDPPEGFQEQLDKTWGTKNFLLASLADYLCPNV